MLFLLTGVVSPLQAASQSVRQIVQEIRFDPPQPGERYRARVNAKIGQDFDADAVRDSIAGLYSTGRFSEIAVDLTGGVLTFHAPPNFFVGVVTVTGLKSTPSPVEAVNVTKMQLGELYTDTKREQAVEAIGRLMLANGFHHATVTPHVTPHVETWQSDIDFEVAPGKQARLSELQWVGDPGFLPAKLLQKSGLKPGSPVTAKRLINASQKLRKFYESQQLLTARADLVNRLYDSKTETEKVIFRMIQGPKIIVHADSAKISNKKLRGILPIYEEGAADADLVREGARDLRDYLQSIGYFEAKVQDQLDEDLRAGIVTVTYKVDRGAKHRLDRVEIAGNRFFDKLTLLERMTITPNSATGKGRFSRGLLDADVASIKGLYRSNGFRQVSINVEVDDDYNRKQGLVHVRLNIVEGPQTLVGELKFEGNKAIPPKELLGVVEMQSGQAFSEENAALDRDNILAYYYDRGFPDATFAWKSSVEVHDKVNLTYTVSEGAREYVGQVIVDGENRTQHHIIERQIQLKPGEPLSQTERLDTQRNLYDLGIFNRVDVVVQNPDGDESQRTMLVQVDEAGRWSLATGFGAEIARIGGGSTVSLDSPEGSATIAPRVSFDATRVNVFGLGQTIAFKSLVGTVQQRGSVLYTAPRIMDNPKLTLYLTGLAARTEDIRTFTALRFEGSAALAWNRSRTDTVIYRLNFHRVKEYDLKISPSIIPTASQPVRVAMPSITYIHDHRDNPADSHRGVYWTADAGVSTGWLGSQANFTHFYTQHSSYYTIHKDVVLARNTLFGLQEPYGGLRTETVMNADGTTSVVHTREIPFAEAFFSGGANSQRGFNTNQAGPRDPVTGFPIGGNALLMNSVEVRFPIQRPDVGGVLFYDAGNVYKKVGDISFRLHQNDRADFNYMVHAAGFGIRYKTPIGPVRVDLAWAFNPPAYYGVNGTLSDLINSKIPLTPVARRLSHFQFFFSIGQTY